MFLYGKNVCTLNWEFITVLGLNEEFDLNKYKDKYVSFQLLSEFVRM